MTMVAVSIVVVVIVAVDTGGALRMTCMVVMRSVVAEGVVVTFRTPGAAVTGAASVTARAVLAAAAMVAVMVVMALVAMVFVVVTVIVTTPMVMVIPVIPVIPVVPMMAAAMVIVRTTRRTGRGMLVPSGDNQCNGSWNGGGGGMQGWMHAFQADMCRGQRTRCEQAGNACQQKVSDEFHDYLPGAGKRLMTTGIGPGRAGAR